ncbi:MAG TPA: flavin reductase family protein [Solirubrobacterales bacterium]|nr:flavin reductase family protein [Solirubrobacterales bacterium]
MRQEIPYDQNEGRRFHGLLNSVIVPRPIAWVSTTSPEGVDNLAPHSYFTVSSVIPAIVQFTSVGHNDSLRNAVETGEFVVNLATRPDFEKVNATATSFPPEVSEFDAVGIEREPSSTVRPPRVASSPVAIECATEGTRDFGDSVVVFGRLQHIAIDEDVLTDGRPDITKLEPLARLGGPLQWSEIGEIREITRIPHDEWPGHFDPG